MGTSDIGQRLAEAVERMPAFPRSVQRLLELTRDPDVDARAVVAVLETDPVMTARILKTINSAFYGLSRQVASVQHAVVLLGINTVKHMALAISASGMLPARNAAGFESAAYLRHSLTVAALARLVAPRLGADPGEAYVAGLLHDFGEVLIAVNLPEDYRTIRQLAERDGLLLQAAEQAVLGTDHTHAGALLAERWQFPATLVESIAGHHGDAGAPGAVLQSLRLADGLSHAAACGDQPVAPAAPAAAQHAALGVALPPDGEAPWSALLAALPGHERVGDEVAALLAGIR